MGVAGRVMNKQRCDVMARMGGGGRGVPRGQTTTDQVARGDPRGRYCTGEFTTRYGRKKQSQERKGKKRESPRGREGLQGGRGQQSQQAAKSSEKGKRKPKTGLPEREREREREGERERE